MDDGFPLAGRGAYNYIWWRQDLVKTLEKRPAGSAPTPDGNVVHRHARWFM